MATEVTSQRKMWDDFWGEFLANKTPVLRSKFTDLEPSGRTYCRVSFEDLRQAVIKAAAIVGGDMTGWPYYFGSAPLGGNRSAFTDKGEPVRLDSIRQESLDQFNNLSTAKDLMDLLGAMATAKVRGKGVRLFDIALTPEGFCIAKIPYPL